VIDLGRIFSIKDNADKGHDVMILSVKGRIIGILVDSIGTIMDIRDDELEMPPSTILKDERKYISGVKRLENELLVHLMPENLIGMGKKTPNYMERRKHTRKAVDILAVYSIAYDESGFKWQPCRILDVSLGGTRLLVDEHLNIGTDIKIRIKDDMELEGMVISSVLAENKSGEYVGIRFNEHYDSIEQKIKELVRAN